LESIDFVSINEGISRLRHDISAICFCDNHGLRRLSGFKHFSCLNGLFLHCTSTEEQHSNNKKSYSIPFHTFMFKAKDGIEYKDQSIKIKKDLLSTTKNISCNYFGKIYIWVGVTKNNVWYKKKRT